MFFFSENLNLSYNHPKIVQKVIQFQTLISEGSKLKETRNSAKMYIPDSYTLHCINHVYYKLKAYALNGKVHFLVNFCFIGTKIRFLLN